MPYNSSVVIARLLASEGFTDRVGNEVEKYWKASIMRTARARRIERLEREFSAMIQAKMDEKEKLLLGRFIAIHKRMSFDTGLRIGLTAFALKTDKEGKTVEEEQREIIATNACPQPE